jgi:tRNA-splicing ligase RtcB
MNKIIATEGKPIKIWLDDIDEMTLVQARNMANLPFIYSHVCLMPDAHAGYGMPIGGVLAADNVIIPNAVGVDIGCGMYSVKTNLHSSEISKEKLIQLTEAIKNRIPLGFNHHNEKQDESLMPQNFDVEKLPVVKQQYQSALKQLGTLGGGNHFIEIQKDQAGFIWIMVHSGSRNIGLKVAEFYNRKAKKMNELWFSSSEPKADLAFLPFGSTEAQQYYIEMKYCVNFAFANRKLMITRIMESISDAFGEVEFSEHINIAHNYAAWEEHFGKKVLVHRKGATSAREGEIGIIPGSQGTKSYIVEGLGNPQSFMSCSHGAGRAMGRKQAIRTLNLEEEMHKMDALGIIHSMNSLNDLDEAASAYKDISLVMNQQADLVKIIHELSPLAVVKG